MTIKVIIETDGIVALVGDYNVQQRYVENIKPVYVKNLTGDEEVDAREADYIRYTIETGGKYYKESRLKTPEEFQNA